MANDHSTERIPVKKGVYISFSPDGLALHEGCKDDEIIPIVEDRCALLEKWLYQKERQVEEDERLQQTESERGKVQAELRRLSSEMLKHLRKAGAADTELKKFQDEMEKWARPKWYKQRSLPEEDE